MDISNLKIGNEVCVINKSIAWHKENNNRTHISNMDKYIGKIGKVCIIPTHDDSYLVIEFPDGGVYHYSINCLEPVIGYHTELSKCINTIYLKEKEKLKCLKI